MDPINYQEVLNTCLSVAKNNFGKAYNDAKPFAEHSFQQFAEDAVFLTKLRVANTIDDEELKHRLNNQKIALSNVLLMIEGIGLIQAQNTVNDVVKIVSNAVLGAVHVTLPI